MIRLYELTDAECKRFKTYLRKNKKLTPAEDDPKTSRQRSTEFAGFFKVELRGEIFLNNIVLVKPCI